MMIRNLSRLSSRAHSQHVVKRSLAAVASSGSTNPLTVGPFRVFDREAKTMQKDRSATLNGGERSRTVDYVREEVADRLLERLLDIKRKFDVILDLGAGPGHFTKLVEESMASKVIMIDSSEKLLYREKDDEFDVPVQRIVADEEELLNVIKPNSQDAIVSCMNLHWINDLPGMLVQIKEALKPDGVFLGAIVGGDTLFELRTALQLAEVEREGGISPHVSPMTDTRDVTNLLGRAGFTLTTVDTDEIRVAYPSMWELMDDLRDMGESNAVVSRRPIIHRDTLTAAVAIYKEMHGQEDGSIPATFQIIYMIGWKPGPDQPQPLKRGSGQTNLKEVL